MSGNTRTLTFATKCNGTSLIPYLRKGNNELIEHVDVKHELMFYVVFRKLGGHGYVNLTNNSYSHSNSFEFQANSEEEAQEIINKKVEDDKVAITSISKYCLTTYTYLSKHFDVFYHKLEETETAEFRRPLLPKRKYVFDTLDYHLSDDEICLRTYLVMLTNFKYKPVVKEMIIITDIDSLSKLDDSLNYLNSRFDIQSLTIELTDKGLFDLSRLSHLERYKLVAKSIDHNNKLRLRSPGPINNIKELFLLCDSRYDTLSSILSSCETLRLNQETKTRLSYIQSMNPDITFPNVMNVVIENYCSYIKRNTIFDLDGIPELFPEAYIYRTDNKVHCVRSIKYAEQFCNEQHLDFRFDKSNPDKIIFSDFSMSKKILTESRFQGLSLTFERNCPVKSAALPAKR